MTRHFCTYFDVNYLSRGLALYHSLRAHCPRTTLWVLCLDEETVAALNRLRLPGLEPISLKEFEHGDTELIAAKGNRTRIEYYFTCTPSLPWYVFRHCPQADLVTYLDADLFFFSDPGPLFQEMGTGSIAIIAHRFPEELRHLERYGIYNVGWVSFRRDENALSCLRAWRADCIEWCCDREDNGRFADQKYLNAWPSRYPGVVVLGHAGANVAPWNLGASRLELVGGKVTVNRQPLVFFHFHGFKHSPQTGYDFNLKAYGEKLTPLLGQHVFYPYVRMLSAAADRISRLGGPISLSGGIRKYGMPAPGSSPGAAPLSAAPPVDNRRFQPAAPPESHTRISGLRRELARFWLNASAEELANHYAGDAREFQRKAAIGPFKDTPPSAEERGLARQAADRMRSGAEGPELARLFLVAMMYMNPHELPPDFDLMKLPEWLRGDAFHFQLTTPNLLNELGESEACCAHLDRLVSRLHHGLRASGRPSPWTQMAILFQEKANFLPLYFSRRNLKQICVRRADIVDFAIRLKGQELDYGAPPRAGGGSRIRLGVYCYALRATTETYATLPVFAHLDPREFDVRLYVHQGDGNPIEQRARGMAGSFTVLPETLKASVETLRADDLDILVFGNNITAGGGFAFGLSNYRMARVQCIHFCNPTSSGKRHVDGFLLGELIADRLEAEEHFSEKILKLEGSGICFDLPDAQPEAVDVFSRRGLRIPETGTVFMSGANYFKIVPELRHTWAKILREVPGSVLLLYPFGPAWSNHYPQQRLVEGLERVFEEYGIHPERLVVMNTLKGREEILALNRIADVYLDAVPYNGATSLLDPLQEGVPTVVVDGRDLRFAQGAAILRELGVPELITFEEKEYIRLAVQLGTDSGLRTAMRCAILERMRAKPAFLDPRLYADRVSKVFRSLVPEGRPQPSPAPAGYDRRIEAGALTAA